MKKSIILGLLAVAVTSQAASILSDDFSYPDGAIVGAAGSPWLANSGNVGSMWATNSELEVAGSVTGRTEDIAAPLSGGPYMSNGVVTTIYSKFTVYFTTPPSGAGTYFAHITGENITTDYRARLFASVTNVATLGNAAAGNFFLGIGNSSSTLGLSVPWPAELTTNVVYTLVIKYELATGLSTLWVNPVDESSASVTATLSPSLTNPKYFGFRQASSGGVARIDALRIGTLFSDVAGANTAPTISAIPAQYIPRDGNSGAVSFVVGDAESLAGTLTVARASTNTTVVPLSGIVINDGDGTNRTVTVTPAAGQQGRSLVTLTVSDGANTASSSFLVTVGAPSISAIPNQIVGVNAAVPPVPFTVVDAESDALTYVVSSSNPNILQTANITVNGTGSARTISMTPEANTNGFTIVTLTFDDGFNSSTRTFALTIAPSLGLLLQDRFPYDTFLLPNALLQASDSVSGQASPWLHASGTLYELQSTNGWAYLSSALGEDLGAPLTNSAWGYTYPDFTNYASSEGVVFFSSFTLRVTELPQGEGDYFAHLKNSYLGTTFRAKVFVTTNGAAAGDYRIGIANQANGGTYLPLNCSLNTDYLVVTRYNSAIGEATLWVNPASESSTSISAADALQTSPIGSYGLRQSSGIGALQISNLVVSTSFPSLPVLPREPMTITAISLSGGTVTIDFDAGASDTTASFNLHSGDTVHQATNSTPSSSIISVGTGKFQATAPVSGAAKFYRIHRP